jgi:hypothetical protein
VAQRGRADITLLETPTVIAQAPEKTQRARYPLKWTALVPDGRGGEMAGVGNFRRRLRARVR